MISVINFFGSQGGFTSILDFVRGDRKELDLVMIYLKALSNVRCAAAARRLAPLLLLLLLLVVFIGYVCRFASCFACRFSPTTPSRCSKPSMP